MVSHREIEANPEKIGAILNMKPPKNVKDIQKLTGCLAAVNRFISCLGEKGHPFFKIIKKADNFQWTDEVDTAFKDLKRYLTSPPVLTAPTRKDELLLYVAATTHVVSTVIVVEREEEGKVFISEVLSKSKVRYPQVQKLLYVVFITSCKLRHYFQDYSITVVIKFPLGDILHNPYATGRISKWAVELGAFTIKFASQTAIKSQALADFTVEWTEVQVATSIQRLEH
jgi:hypothetical protein